ncbi:reverse transcriptase domain-containing protein [Tanacetum coccineum]
MVTPVEKRSSNKFYDFHNDKGHSTDECRDQTKVGKKEVPAKDNSLAIYIVQPWHRMTRQKVTQSFARVSKITFPPFITTKGTEGPLVIEAEIGGHMIHHIYVDGGSSTESTIRSTILIPAEFATVTTSSKKILREAEVRHENLEVALHPNFLDQKVVIGRTLSAKGRTELCSFLKENLDIFAWQLADMTGVPRSVAEHRLNIREGYSPVQQKKRGQAPESAKAIQAEVHKLVEAGIMREVYYYNWLSNPVMVKKHDGSWRMWRGFHGLKQGLSAGLFLSKSAEKSLPLFKTLKKCIKKSDFHWTPEAEQDFKQLKQHLSDLTLLVTPKPKEELIVYLSASHGAISADLMTERGTVQTPVYFVSRALQGPELNYTPMEKLVLALMHNKATTEITSVVEILQGPWTLFTDGSSCVDRSGAGLILTSPEGTKFTYALRFQFTASNNRAEYEALIAGLRIAAQMGVRNVHLSEDSKLEVATVVEEEGPTWMTSIMEYLKDGTLPDDRNEASKLRIKARQYELLEGVLYRRSFLKPWLRCVGLLQADYVIREIHEGSYSMNARPRSMVAKAMRLGYYWPTMHRDAQNMIRTCNDCQIHRPEGPGKVKFLIVAMDYFTKWIEAKAAATITGNQVKNFMWDNIICLFGLPRKIVSDNGKQFNNNPLKDWCEKLNITERFASVKHLQSNGLVERANRSLGEGIKARLGEGNKNWIKELPRVLWAHRTMIKSSHGDTPFSLTYRTEAIIPTEIGMPKYRTAVVDAVHNNEELRLNLDLLEEWRERATIREVRAKLKMTKYYNARVRGVTFRPGDFVYRSNKASHAMDGGGKARPKVGRTYKV